LILPALEHHTYREDDVEGGIKIKKKGSMESDKSSPNQIQGSKKQLSSHFQCETDRFFGVLWTQVTYLIRPKFNILNRGLSKSNANYTYDINLEMIQPT
jgi:hypothetical protein